MYQESGDSSTDFEHTYDKMSLTMVIDTDCGSDDAMAIMATLGDSGRRACRLVAITCCFGNTTIDHVCQNVLKVLHACGETKVPVYRGSSTSLLPHPKFPERVHGWDGFGDCSHLFPSNGMIEETPAPAALVALSRTHPRLTLTVLGPLTNVALAHRIDPDFTSRLERIVFMGGNYKGEHFKILSCSDSQPHSLDRRTTASRFYPREGQFIPGRKMSMKLAWGLASDRPSDRAPQRPMITFTGMGFVGPHGLLRQ
ncbi:probable uridine nucleosidase 1 [Trichonephila clavipes]|nr:probable uridine nucleosidase 1 [Trichonephila clavipes]